MTENRRMEQTLLQKSEIALCRSALYEALALGFARPLPGMMNRLLTEEHNSALAELAANLDNSTSDQDAASLENSVHALLTNRSDTVLVNLQRAHLSLFGHTAQPAVPPYETEYGEVTLFQQPQQLSDIAGFYEAFGLTLNGAQHERVDHLSCECEFMAFLTRKEAYSLEKNDDEMLAETRKAQRLFLRDHIGRFAPSFCNLLIKKTANGFYNSLAKLGRNFVLSECQRFGVPAGPESLRLRPAAMEEDDFTCGSGESLVQITNRSNAVALNE